VINNTPLGEVRRVVRITQVRMNKNSKAIQNLSEKELELGIDGTKGSWHDEYKDSPYIFIGGLPFDLNEGDVTVSFSQWGVVNHVNLIRDKKDGKSKGFAFIGYEDQRSTILAVDNMNGTQIAGRAVTVSHKNGYEPPEEGDSDESSQHNDDDEGEDKNKKREKKRTRPPDLDEVDQPQSKKQKKQEKKGIKKEKKRKELMRLALSQQSGVTLDDLLEYEKLKKKGNKLQQSASNKEDSRKNNNTKDTTDNTKVEPRPEKRGGTRDDRRGDRRGDRVTDRRDNREVK